MASLTAAGRMKPAGLKETEAARKDGRWERAYEPQGAMELLADSLKALAKGKKAKAFFESLNRASHCAIAWQPQTAKRPAPRSRRMQAILTMLTRREFSWLMTSLFCAASTLAASPSKWTD